MTFRPKPFTENRDIRWRLSLAVFDVLLYGYVTVALGRDLLRWLGWAP